MNIPAYTSPNLCIGRTFDIENATAGSDIFPSGIQTKEINVNKFSFKYSLVKNSKDVNDLLDISGELSLKIKANLLKVEGAGQYINKSGTEEGTTTLMAVMKCTTVTETTETIKDEVKPTDNTAGLGTHYVRSVTYGAELVAKVSFRTTSADKKEDIKGKAEGDLSLQAVNVGLKAALEKLTEECNSVSDLQVDYYSTSLPDKLPTTIEKLISLIETFPSDLKNINEGKGIPMTFELLPVTNIIPTARAALQDRVKAYELEEMERFFDDVRRALNLADEYLKSAEEQHDDVKSFIGAAKKVERAFRKAISALGGSEEKKLVEESQKAYEDALDGLYKDDKFVQHWKQEILAKKKPICKIKLPEGRPLTLVLLGKTGNGKSETGNSILGRAEFESSTAAQAVTKECKRGERRDERKIDVIDTPGVLDTEAVALMAKDKSLFDYFNQNKKKQTEILQEIARIFAMTPDGCDGFILVMKYGCRFTQDDAQALKMLENLLGEDAYNNIILLLTHGDQMEREAKKKKQSADVTLNTWLQTLPDWVTEFIASVDNRIFPFNNLHLPDEHPEEYKQQLSRFITMVDTMTKGKPFIHPLTKTSKAVLDKQIEEALDQSGVNEQLKLCQKKREELEQQPENEKNKKFTRLKARLIEAIRALIKQKMNVEDQITQEQKETGGQATKAILDQMSGSEGGCYPGSATVVDFLGRERRMDSLLVEDEIQVMTSEGICIDPVITFIHRQPEVLQEFLKIATLKKRKILKITGDHLMFVQRKGRASTIPAREVSIGDTVYVRGDQGAVETDVVQSISSIIEKGVYAPVTHNGTILVNDVHTSCYFDVLSHEWSHRAMGVARAVYHVSPCMVEWISRVGQKDGYPGWSRLAHKILTFMD